MKKRDTKAARKKLSQPRVPLLSSQQIVFAFRRLNFLDMPATGGSHHTMYRWRLDGTKDVVTVTLGKREIPRGTLRSFLRQAGVPLRTFIKAVRR